MTINRGYEGLEADAAEQATKAHIIEQSRGSHEVYRRLADVAMEATNHAEWEDFVAAHPVD